MLADLGRGVGRLKTQSVLINEETSLHVRLLDDMEGDAERASTGLRSEARHAENVIFLFFIYFDIVFVGLFLVYFCCCIFYFILFLYFLYFLNFN